MAAAITVPTTSRRMGSILDIRNKNRQRKLSGAIGSTDIEMANDIAAITAAEYAVDLNNRSTWANIGINQQNANTAAANASSDAAYKQGLLRIANKQDERIEDENRLKAISNIASAFGDFNNPSPFGGQSPSNTGSTGGNSGAPVSSNTTSYSKSSSNTSGTPMGVSTQNNWYGDLATGINNFNRATDKYTGPGATAINMISNTPYASIAKAGWGLFTSLLNLTSDIWGKNIVGDPSYYTDKTTSYGNEEDYNFQIAAENALYDDYNTLGDFYDDPFTAPAPSSEPAVDTSTYSDYYSDYDQYGF